MPEAESEAPKKRGRPKGSGKKRHDPEPAPVNGDYSKDVVLGKEAGKRYAWLTPNGIDADVPNFKHRGYRKTERTPDGPRPAWDMGAENDSGFAVGGLELYEADEETVARYEAHQRTPSERRMQSIHDTAAATGGYMTRNVEK
jgi:hypothetical protein